MAYEETIRLIILGPLVTLFVKTLRWKHGMDITLETRYTGLTGSNYNGTQHRYPILNVFQILQSDESLISPCKINTKSNGQVTRINRIINEGYCLDANITRNAWQSV